MSPTDHQPKYRSSVYTNTPDEIDRYLKIIILSRTALALYDVETKRVRLFNLEDINAHFKYDINDDRIRFWATDYHKVCNTWLPSLTECSTIDALLELLPETLL